MVENLKIKGFLHNHPGLEYQRNIPKDHIVVDTKDADDAKLICKKQIYLDKICKKAIEHFGKENLIIKCIEELNELAVALTYYKYGKIPSNMVINEIVDFLITLNQIIVLFGKHNFDDRIKKKLYQLNKYIDSDKKLEKHLQGEKIK